MSSNVESKSDISAEYSIEADENTGSSTKILCFWSKTDPDWNAD